MLNIGLYIDDLYGWQGGRDLCFMMHDSLRSCVAENEQLVVVTAREPDGPFRRALRVAKHTATHWPQNWRWMREELFRKRKEANLRKDFGQSVRLAWLRPGAQEFHSWTAGDLGSSIGPFRNPPAGSDKLAWLGYLPDCQHKYLPQFFSAEECEKRDREYEQLLHSASVVVVNSTNARDDLNRFYAPYSAEVVSLPFSSSPDASWFAVDAASVRSRYGLERDYFICCNQFWIHKNHGLILDALRIAKERGRDFVVVCTGETNDVRDAGYFGRLMERAKELKVETRFVVLGLIPKEDQIGLLKSAIAVVQPTLFEGGPGGGAAYEGIALGKRVLLSDIPVNREIAGHSVVYFDPTDANALFEVMASCSDVPAAPDPEELMRIGRERRIECGRVLLSAFRRVGELHRERHFSAQ
jgi:glycosyltransferase involved in cell wall biosynthesis